ncbi:MAG: ComF family protein [Kiritimatiellae bacterium]|nr:ComF family protein [Kiritimatiellia bacterium]
MPPPPAASFPSPAPSLTTPLDPAADWERHPLARYFSHRATMLRMAADFLLSRQCYGCGATLHETDPGVLCMDCRALLPLLTAPLCERCGDYAGGAIDGPYLCPACRAHPPAFDWARSAMHYAGAVQPVVRDLKYHQQLACLEEMAFWMLTLWSDTSRPPCPKPPMLVLGVPMSFLRLRTRGFNHADGLAREVARALRIPHATRVLVRTRATPSQTTMTARQRRENVHAAFAVARPKLVRDRAILLVDDVMTTGSTLSECARALKAAGATHVYCLTAARGG